MSAGALHFESSSTASGRFFTMAYGANSATKSVIKNKGGPIRCAEKLATG